MVSVGDDVIQVGPVGFDEAGGFRFPEGRERWAFGSVGAFEFGQGHGLDEDAVCGGAGVKQENDPLLRNVGRGMNCQAILPKKREQRAFGL
jgi:hypothetical protein